MQSLRLVLDASRRGFIAAVNAWRRRARQEVGDQLLLLSSRAMNNVRHAVYNNNLQASLTVLKS